MDEYDFVSVNRERQLKSNEPFILASQVSLAFYAIDHWNRGWHVVLKSQPQYSKEMLAVDNSNSASYESWTCQHVE